MRQIKLSGRERAVVRAIGFAEGMGGEEIREHTRIPAEDLTDVLNALLGAGFVESQPYRDQITTPELATLQFEVNPSYVHEIKGAMKRAW
jgi:hypothetical protein